MLLKHSETSLHHRHQVKVAPAAQNQTNSPQDERARFLFELIEDLNDQKEHMTDNTGRETCSLQPRMETVTYLILFKHNQIVQFMKLIKVQALLFCSHFLHIQRVKRLDYRYRFIKF